jgi:hypothetical protein
VYVCQCWCVCVCVCVSACKVCASVSGCMRVGAYLYVSVCMDVSCVFVCLSALVCR